MRGGARPGAGRPRGSGDEIRTALAELVDRSGRPLTVALEDIAGDETVATPVRLRALDDLHAILHWRLRNRHRRAAVAVAA